MNVFKLAEGEAGIMVSSGRAIPSKRANLPSSMTAITGTMLLRGTLDNKNGMKHYRSMARTTSNYPSLKLLFKAK